MKTVKLYETRDLRVRMTNYCGGVLFIQYCFKDNYLDQFAKIRV